MRKKTPSNPKKSSVKLSQYQKQKRYKDTHWSYRLIENAKGTARRRNIDLDIDRFFLEKLWDNQRGLCFWTQVPLLKNGPVRHPQKASVDRIDSSKGYLRENIVLACQFANLGKSAVNIRTFFEFLETLRSTFTAVKVIRELSTDESSETPPSTKTK